MFPRVRLSGHVPLDVPRDCTNKAALLVVVNSADAPEGLKSTLPFANQPEEMILSKGSEVTAVP